MPVPSTKVLPVEERVSKRRTVRDALIRQNTDLVLVHQKLLKFVPDPNQNCSKRIWERQMWRAREIFRCVCGCDEEGNRHDMHNFLMKNFRSILDGSRALRLQVPDPADELTDEQWIDDWVDMMILLCEKEDERLSAENDV